MQTRTNDIDKATIRMMAASMRDGFDTRDLLVPIYGRDNVDRLGDRAAELARKGMASVH